METFSALLEFWAWNSPVTGEKSDHETSFCKTNVNGSYTNADNQYFISLVFKFANHKGRRRSFIANLVFNITDQLILQQFA